MATRKAALGGRRATNRQQQLETLLQRIEQTERHRCEWPGCRRNAARFFLPVGENSSSSLLERVNLVYCVPHFGAARESERLFYPPPPSAAESYFQEEKEKYPDDADGLKRLLKRGAQQGFDLDNDSPSFRRMKESCTVKLFFVARDLKVKGEPPTDALIPAGLLRRRRRFRNFVELRMNYSDPAQADAHVRAYRIYVWHEMAKEARKLPERFDRAARGAADQGRPQGSPDKSGRARRAPHPDVEARTKSRIAAYERFLAEFSPPWARKRLEHLAGIKVDSLRKLRRRHPQ